MEKEQIKALAENVARETARALVKNERKETENYKGKQIEYVFYDGLKEWKIYYDGRGNYPTHSPDKTLAAAKTRAHAEIDHSK